jgi:hypothetical protein
MLMLITFKCRSAPDVVMLENLAQYLVGIVGKKLGERGVITHDELDAAIKRLEAAIVVDKKETAEHEGHFHEFLDMLRAAKKENTDVLWGV